MTQPPDRCQCRLYGHDFPDPPAPGMFSAERAAYHAGLTEPRKAMCARCKVERVDYPDGRRTYTYPQQAAR